MKTVMAKVVKVERWRRWIRLSREAKTGLPDMVLKRMADGKEMDRLPLQTE